jgi:hypothetical protein
MHNSTISDGPTPPDFLGTSEERKTTSLALIWVPIGIVICLVLLALGVVYFQANVVAAPLADFDKMIVTNGFHNIRLASGQRWELSYEQNHDRLLTGQVRHTSMDHETLFPIISFDILVTSGDFSDPSLVSTSVSDHHFSWMPLTATKPQGTINLLHTVPMNQAVEDELMKIKDGDTVTVEGWDILKINGYDKDGKYIGYWTDEGCNTTLITNVTIK